MHDAMCVCVARATRRKATKFDAGEEIPVMRACVYIGLRLGPGDAARSHGRRTGEASVESTLTRSSQLDDCDVVSTGGRLTCEPNSRCQYQQ